MVVGFRTTCAIRDYYYPQEKEQKDKQWSTRKRTKRQTMVHNKKNKKTNNGPQ
jgi:hypothetical protein